MGRIWVHRALQYHIVLVGVSDKASSKGLNKSQNKLKKDKFLNVLRDQKCRPGDNRGLSAVNGEVFTHSQVKNTLGCFYPKTQVSSDGVCTKSLDIQF